MSILLMIFCWCVMSTPIATAFTSASSSAGTASATSTWARVSDNHHFVAPQHRRGSSFSLGKSRRATTTLANSSERDQELERLQRENDRLKKELAKGKQRDGKKDAGFNPLKALGARLREALRLLPRHSATPRMRTWTVCLTR